MRDVVIYLCKEFVTMFALVVIVCMLWAVAVALTDTTKGVHHEFYQQDSVQGQGRP